MSSTVIDNPIIVRVCDSLEVTDPWDAQNTIRAHLDATAAASA